MAWSQVTPTFWTAINAVQFSHTTKVWSAPQLLSTATDTANWPQVSTDPGGNVTVLWQENFGNSSFSISSARFDAATKTWSPPFPIQTLENYIFNPFSWPTSMTVDAGGNLTAAWIQGDSSGAGPVAYATRFDFQTKPWSVPAQLDGTATAAAGGVSLAVDAHGTVLGGWGRQGASSFVTPMCAL